MDPLGGPVVNWCPPLLLFERTKDYVDVGKRDLKAAGILVSIIYSSSECRVPIYRLSRHRGQLGLPNDLKLATYIRRVYPTIFVASSFLDSGGSPVPCFGFRDRLCRLLMLTRDWILVLQTIDQLKWDLGLPYDLQHSFVLNHPERFSFVRLPDDRVGLKLLFWDNRLAIRVKEKCFSTTTRYKKEPLHFWVSFTRGFGLKRKSMEWLKKWQKLPYTAP